MENKKRKITDDILTVSISFFVRKLMKNQKDWKKDDRLKYLEFKIEKAVKKELSTILDFETNTF